MLAVSMMTSVGTAGVLKNMSNDSSAASTASKNSVSTSLEFTSTQMESALNWLGAQSTSALIEVEASIVSVAGVSESAIRATLELSTDAGKFLVDVVIASANTSAQAITTAYNEGRAVNVTVIKPAAIARAAKGNLVQKSLGLSGESLNKSLETSASVAVSIAASSAQIVISPVTFSEELRSVRQAR